MREPYKMARIRLEVCKERGTLTQENISVLNQWRLIIELWHNKVEPTRSELCDVITPQWVGSYLVPICILSKFLTFITNLELNFCRLLRFSSKKSEQKYPTQQDICVQTLNTITDKHLRQKKLKTTNYYRLYSLMKLVQIWTIRGHHELRGFRSHSGMGT